MTRKKVPLSFDGTENVKKVLFVSERVCSREQSTELKMDTLLRYLSGEAFWLFYENLTKDGLPADTGNA